MKRTDGSDRSRCGRKMKTSRLVIAALLLATRSFGAADYAGWKCAGSMFILTTPDGADLPASAQVDNFPLLVRLNSTFFDFAAAKADGSDLRFSARDGAALPYQIEAWDAAQGEAVIWVRVPMIRGNDRQEIRLHWGKPDAMSESNGRAVFNDSNGYLSVWHMNDPVQDEVGTLESQDAGTTAAAGVVGPARRFPGQGGIYCGDKIMSYPTGSVPHSTEAWFRAEKPNANLVAWGNEQRQGKVVVQYRSPPHLNVDAYFSGGNVEGAGRLNPGEWTHVLHTFEPGEARLYVNGRLDGKNEQRGSTMAIQRPARLWMGGWYNRYDFVGELDEVRVSKVARSPEWVKLQYENQKPMQTLVGPVVQSGAAWSVSAPSLTVREGQHATVTAEAGGAQKVCWILKRGGAEQVVAVDRLRHTFAAGRVTGDEVATLQFKAVYPNEVKTGEVAIKIREDIAEPAFTLNAPARWDGRETIEVVPRIANLAAMQARGAGDVKTEWTAGPFAVIKEVAPGKLLLRRAQNSGTLTVTATMSNGGPPVTQRVQIAVREPEREAWVPRVPGKDEQPEDGQFYACDDRNEGTLFCNGLLTDAAEAVFLRLYADDKLIETETAKPAADGSYALSVKLKPGLIKYRVEFGTRSGGQDKVLRTVSDIVCGDAFLIDGQSNALATDTREEAPAVTNTWIRSYGRPAQPPKEQGGNLWCCPVWKARQGEKAELGWWGMELARRLLESRKVPVFILNGAVGGTRIDQHQRNEADPTDLSTIYGRMLWRAQQARITHGIRAILWHQGESDQGADGPSGGFGWETYRQQFVEMAGGWKRDFPNVQRYYIFQIWPNACAMGGRDGAGDRLREKQRTLPRLFSNMRIMSTLGIRPEGGCHYPLTGWAEFARLIQPLIERDLYGLMPGAAITPPDLVRAVRAAGDTIALEFDQPVVWTDKLAGQFYLDGGKDLVASGSVAGSVLTLKLKAPLAAKTITYLKEVSWSQDTLLMGVNGIAALTFCEVPLATAGVSP
jgi:hypothetical protein